MKNLSTNTHDNRVGFLHSECPSGKVHVPRMSMIEMSQIHALLKLSVDFHDPKYHLYPRERVVYDLYVDELWKQVRVEAYVQPCVVDKRWISYGFLVSSHCCRSKDGHDYSMDEQ